MDPSSHASSLRRRLTDLETFQLPRLRNCHGPIGLHGELADELRLDLESVRKGLEALAEEVELVDDRELEERLRGIYDNLKDDWKRLRIEYRSAVLHSKKQISTSSSSSSRYELTASSGPSTTGIDPIQPPASSGSTNTYPPNRSEYGRGEADEVQTKTNEVTDALRRTLGTMQVELERSVLSVQMLEESTRTLRATSNLYDTYTSLLSTSSQLVKALERADWYDRLIIALAFMLFLLTVGWVIKRRVLDKVAGGVGWWVGGSYRLVRMGLGGKGQTADKGIMDKGVKQGIKGVQTALGKGSGTGQLVAGASTVAVLVANALSGTVSSGIGKRQTTTLATLPGTSTTSTEPIPFSRPPASDSAISPSDPAIVRDEL